MGQSKSKPGEHACQAWWLPTTTRTWTEWRGLNQVQRQTRVRSGFTGSGKGLRWSSCTLTDKTLDASYYRDIDNKIDYYFDKYLPDGRMQYCELRHRDIGWNWKSFNIRNWRQYYDYCKLHQLYKPKIRSNAREFIAPRIYGGPSSLELTQKSYDSNALGNFAGNVYKIKMPVGWTARCFSGVQFNGVSDDFVDERQLSDPTFVRSLQIGPSRPAILSRADNHLKQRWIAYLDDLSYSSSDLNDGVFLHTNNHRQLPTYYKTGIEKVWVPVGYQVTLYSENFSGATQVVYGHNTSGWVTPNFVVRSIRVRIVLPIMFSKPNFAGFPSTLQAGDNTQSSSRPVKSAFVPSPAYTVVGKSFGAAATTFPERYANINSKFTILELRVNYNTRVNANMIDNQPVRTRVFVSKANFADECKIECSANHDCNAYYALRIKKECPNPKANNGEDPSTNGCRSICGFYEKQGENIRNGDYKSIEPYLFEGNVHVKKIWE